MNQTEKQPTQKVTSKNVKSERPLFWKEVLVTTFTVYPLILGSDWILNFFFPMNLLDPYISIFFTVIMVAALMVNPVMPFVVKYLGNWLNKK